MAQKTFKIGEYAIGGIITVRIVDTIVGINALDWNTKKVVMNNNFVVKDSFFNDPYQEINEYLNELTSFYYAGKILDWIKLNLKIK
jgi:hypothetical protein